MVSVVMLDLKGFDKEELKIQKSSLEPLKKYFYTCLKGIIYKAPVTIFDLILKRHLVQRDRSRNGLKGQWVNPFPGLSLCKR